VTFPKISRQFFDYFPKLVDTLPNFDTKQFQTISNNEKSAVFALFSYFFAFFCQKICICQKKAVPLQPLLKNHKNV